MYRVVVGGKSSWYQLALSISVPSWIHLIPHAEWSTFPDSRIDSKWKFGENVKHSITFFEIFFKLFLFFLFLQLNVCYSIFWRIFRIMMSNIIYPQQIDLSKAAHALDIIAISCNQRTDIIDLFYFLACIRRWLIFISRLCHIFKGDGACRNRNIALSEHLMLTHPKNITITLTIKMLGYCEHKQ